MRDRFTVQGFHLYPEMLQVQTLSAVALEFPFKGDSLVLVMFCVIVSHLNKWNDMSCINTNDYVCNPTGFLFAHVLLICSSVLIFYDSTAHQLVNI